MRWEQPQSLLAKRPRGPMRSLVIMGCAVTCEEFRIKRWEPLLCRLGDVFCPGKRRRSVFLTHAHGSITWRIGQGKQSRALAMMLLSWGQDGDRGA